MLKINCTQFYLKISNGFKFLEVKYFSKGIQQTESWRTAELVNAVVKRRAKKYGPSRYLTIPLPARCAGNVNKSMMVF